MSSKKPISEKKTTSAEPTKEGKKSVREVHRDLGFAPLDEVGYQPYRDELELPAELAKELEDQDLVPRFINRKEYQNIGFHKAHWKPYPVSSKFKESAVFNLSPEGHLMKGDLILAVKPKDWNKAHKEFLQGEAAKLDKASRNKGKEFRKHVVSSGLDSEVVEGFED